jgi:hypothetical protein
MKELWSGEETLRERERERERRLKKNLNGRISAWIVVET